MAVAEHTDIRKTILELLEYGATSELREYLHDIHGADLAAVLESLPPSVRSLVWYEVSESDMGEMLTELSDQVAESLMSEMEPRTLVRVLQMLDIDEIAEIMPQCPSKVAAEILITLDEERRKGLDTVLSYQEDTAGRLMNIDAPVVREGVKVAVIMRYLRVVGELPEYTDKIYVLNRQGKLRGAILLRDLVTASLDAQIDDCIDEDLFRFSPDDPEEQVAQVFERYDLTSAPVVASDGRLLGRITIDDVVDLMKDTAGKNILAPAGLDDEDDIFAPVLYTARRRALWLGINLITAVIASMVIGIFEATIEKLVALAVLMPIIASMGGNAGTQTLTTVIRGLGVGTISTANALDVLKKELLVGGLNGLIWATVVAVVSIVWYQNYLLATIVATAMLVNIVVSALSGVLLPVMLEKVGIDPALAGGVSLTTITDVVGFLAILGIAALVLV